MTLNRISLVTDSEIKCFDAGASREMIMDNRFYLLPGWLSHLILALKGTLDIQIGFCLYETETMLIKVPLARIIDTMYCYRSDILISICCSGSLDMINREICCESFLIFKE